MRAGVAISVFGHGVALVLGLIYAGASPFDPTPADAITVDIVTPDEMTQTANEVPPLPETPPQTSPKTPPDTFSLSTKPAKAAPFNLLPAAAPQQTTQQQTPQQASKPTPQPASQQSPQQAAQQQQNPQRTVRQAAASSPPRAPPEPPQFTPAQPPPPDPAPEEHGLDNMFGMPIMLPGGRVGGFDAPAYETAKVDHDATTAFREHLKTCSTLPAELSPTDKVRIVLRVNLKPDGTLASVPELIEVSGTAKGALLMQSAIKALKQCQPFTMLPTDKYKEWKALDLPFTPQDFPGG